MSKKLLIALGLSFGTLLSIALLTAPQRSESCGPWFQTAIFSYVVHPQLPLENYASGKIGIVKPSFARSYLAVAYRHLSGKPLSPAEQQGAVKLWNTRLFRADIRSRSEIDTTLPQWDSIARVVLPIKKDALTPDSSTIGSMAILDTFAGDGYTSYPYHQINTLDYHYYHSVTPSAVQNATRRLLQLIDQHGRSSEEARDWVRTQRLVFEADPSASLSYTGSNPTIQVDREYQVAASYFYRGMFDSARMQFEKIHSNPRSPWQSEARYLAARAMVRKASLADTIHRNSFAEAESILLSIKDPAKAKQVRHLLDYIYGWTNTNGQIISLSQRLQDNDASDFEHELDDYTKLIDRIFGQVDYYDGSSIEYLRLPEQLRQDDMTDWIHTIQSTDSVAAEHAFERWRTTKSIPWLIAALSKATSLHVSYYVDLDPTSPAYESYVYYMAKLLHREGDVEILRPMLDTALASNLTHSGRNDLMRIRQEIATDMSDLIRMISRTPLGLTWMDDFRELPDADSSLPVDFDAESLRILNRSLPLDRLIEAIELNILRGSAKDKLAMSAWSRAVILGREDDAMRLSVKLEQHPILAPWMKRYRAAAPGVARHREGIFIHLKHPGLSPLVHEAPGRGDSIHNMDSYRDNGWCKLFTDSIAESQSTDGYEYIAPRAAQIAFLTSDERDQTEREWLLLSIASPSPNYLAQEAVKWANAAPKDRDAPEALHLAVRLSRYGCNDDKTGTFSKQAHAVLHKRYKNTKWAQATPYWFE